MAKNFYSGTDADLLSGAENAVAVITPAAATYGVSTAILTAYTALTTAFAAKLELATTPATRTSITVEEKNVAKKSLRAASANLARVVTGTPTVTNAMLLGLRMNERVVRTPRPVPPTPPSIDVVSVVGRLVTVRLHDPSSAGRGLPFGATSAYLFSYVGPTAPADPREFHFEGPTSRAKAQILFPNDVPSGSTVWLSASWVSARGQVGQGSTPISFTLQGGAVPAAA